MQANLTKLVPRWFWAVPVAAASITCGGSDLVLPDEGDPAELAIVRGDGQAGTVGLPLPDSLVVRVTDTKGRPVVAQRVVFAQATSSPGGELSPDTATTDADGRARTRWTLGTAAGSQSVLARVIGTDPELTATFRATAVAGPASALSAVSGDGQTGTAGSPLADPLVVRVTDRFGNPVAGQDVDWSAGGGGDVSARSVPSDDAGHSEVRWVLGPQAGSQTASAAVAGLDGSPVTFTATAAVGSAGGLSIATQPSSTAQSGVPFAQQPAVQLRDRNGNVVRQGGVAIFAAIATGPAGATLTGSAVAATDANGVAAFTNLGISGPGGVYQINFSGVNLSGVTSSDITLAAGAAAKLAFRDQPSSAAATAVLGNVTVEVQDAHGTVVSSATHAVTVALGSNPGGGTLSGTRTVSAVNGVATFPDLSVDKVGSGYTLVAAAPSLAGATSAPFDVTTGPAARLALVTAPSSSVASGQVFPQQPSLQVRDAGGNPVPGAGRTVTVGISAGGGTLGGTTSIQTEAAGRATFTNLSITGSAGSRTLTFSSSGLAAAGATVTVTAGTPAKIAINAGDGQTAAVGTAVPVDPSVLVTDANDNPVAGVAVTFSVASGGGTVSPTTAVATSSNGIAAVTSWTLGPTAGTNTLTATVSGVGSVTFTATGVAGSPGKLAFLVHPGGTVVGAPFSPALQVEVQDANGNRVPGATNQVRLRLGTNPTGASLQGTTTVNAVNGVATFSNVAVSRAGSGYSLSATSSGLLDGTSVAFDIGQASTTTSITSRSPTTSVVGQGVVVDFSVAVAAPGNGTPTGTVTVTDGAGTSCSASVAAGACTITFQSAGARTLTATYAGDANFSGSASGGVSHTVNRASTTTQITGQSATSTVVGEPYVVDFTVAVNAPGGGSLTGTVTVSDQAGASCTAAVAAGSCQLASTSAGTKTLRATYNGTGDYNSSSDTDSHQVGRAATTTAITSDAPDPSSIGQAVTVDYTVSVNGPGAGTPGGNVTVSDGVSSCSGSVAAGSCSLTLTTSGNRTLTATYGGDADFAGSSSPGEPHQVTLTGTSTSLSSSPNPSAFGEQVTFTATVSPASATGTVEFREGSTVLGTGSLSGGQATFNTSGLAVGSHAVTAHYTGNSTHSASTSGTVTHDVVQASTSLQITGDSPDPSTAGSAVSVTWTLSVVAPGSGTPSGNVTVSGGGDSCQAPAASGGCSLNPTQAGGVTLTASYGGDANFSGDADTDSHQVTPGPAAGPSTASVPSSVAAGSTVNITVQARDQFGNQITSGGDAIAVSVTGANDPGGPLGVTDNGDGTYSASYTAANTGQDTVTITANGAGITGSPFTVDVQ